MNDALSYIVSTVNNVSIGYYHDQQHAVTAGACRPANYTISDALLKLFGRCLVCSSVCVLTHRKRVCDPLQPVLLKVPFMWSGRATSSLESWCFPILPLDIVTGAINVNVNSNSSNCRTARPFSAVSGHLQTTETARANFLWMSDHCVTIDLMFSVG